MIEADRQNKRESAKEIAMFVKVMRNGTEAIYECSHVRVHEKVSGVEFSMEDSHKQALTLFVGKEEGLCNVYVMNSDGKTIERYNLRKQPGTSP